MDLLPDSCFSHPRNSKQIYKLRLHCVLLKQSLYTPWRRLGGELLLIHDLGTRWRWVVSITPRPRFTPGERTPGSHCTRGWVGPRAGLDTEDRGKILCPCRGSNPGRPVVQPVVRHYTAWANPVLLPLFNRCSEVSRSRGSSVSIVSGYGLDDRAIEVRSPAEARDFYSNLTVQTGSGAHPASFTMGNGVLSPGVKSGRSVTLTTHPI
jgi:hypothetical protein